MGGGQNLTQWASRFASPACFAAQKRVIVGESLDNRGKLRIYATKDASRHLRANFNLGEE